MTVLIKRRNFRNEIQVNTRNAELKLYKVDVIIIDRGDEVWNEVKDIWIFLCALLGVYSLFGERYENVFKIWSITVILRNGKCVALKTRV